MLHIGALQCLCYSNHIPFRFVVHLLMFWQLRCLIHRIREINKRNNFGTITLLKECKVLHFGDRLVGLHTPYTVCILLYTILLKSTMCYCYKKNVHVHFISRMMKMDILYHVFCFFYIECYSMPLVWAYLSSLQSPASYLTFNLWRTPPPDSDLPSSLQSPACCFWSFASRGSSQWVVSEVWLKTETYGHLE